MFKPEAAKALSDYKLWIKFSDGVEGEVDLSHLAGKGVFSLWNDYDAFLKVCIGKSGEISWADRIDICPDSMYLRITGKSPEQAFPNLKDEMVHARNQPVLWHSHQNVL